MHALGGTLGGSLIGALAAPSASPRARSLGGTLALAFGGSRHNALARDLRSTVGRALNRALGGLFAAASAAPSAAPRLFALSVPQPRAPGSVLASPRRCPRRRLGSAIGFLGGSRRRPWRCSRVQIINSPSPVALACGRGDSVNAGLPRQYPRSPLVSSAAPYAAPSWCRCPWLSPCLRPLPAASPTGAAE